VRYLGNFARLWLWIIWVQTVDETSKKLVETFTTGACDGAANWPDNCKLEQTLKPQCHLPQT